MPVVIQEPSATMSAHYSGARPGVTYHPRGSTDMAVLHQGRNSGPILSGRIRNRTQASAIKLAASVSVLADSTADIQAQYEFHLLQLVWKPVDQALYAGKTASEGSMKLDFSAPPGYPAGSPFLLDADEKEVSPFPFIDVGGAAIRSSGTPGAWLVSLEFDDHPTVDRPLAFPNFAARTSTGKATYNYLYQIERSLFFFTAFVVKDRSTGIVKPFGFINWKSRLLAKIRWVIDADGDPAPQPAQLITAYFTAGDYLPGTPNAAAEKMILNPPTDPSQTYNAIDILNGAAVLASTANSASVQASSSWSASVPNAHFAP
jgi:hypothetical protein